MNGSSQRTSPPGDLTGGGSDALSPCEWILETSPGKGVEIDIKQITGANTDCAKNYLEVELMSGCFNCFIKLCWRAGGGGDCGGGVVD